jgi:hypothetical protein
MLPLIIIILWWNIRGHTTIYLLEDFMFKTWIIQTLNVAEFLCRLIIGLCIYTLEATNSIGEYIVLLLIYNVM